MSFAVVDLAEDFKKKKKLDLSFVVSFGFFCYGFGWDWKREGTREKRLERVREWVERERRDKSEWGKEKWRRGNGDKGVRD